MSKELFTENCGASTIERARELMKKYNIEQAVQIAPDLADFIGVLGQFSKGRELTLMMNFKNSSP
jgi:hypothetical protein